MSMTRQRFVGARGSRGVICAVQVMLIALAAQRLEAQTIPSQTTLELRLLTSVGSHGSRVGDPVRALLIEPVLVDRVVLLPQGSEVHGRVTRARSVGVGFVHETARLQLSFEAIAFPEAEARVPIKAHIVDIDNARESVDKTGTISGIRSTSTFGHRLSGISTLAAVEPTLFVFSFAAFSMVLRFPEPEIFYPAGTEMTVALDAPVQVSRTWPSALGTVIPRDAAGEPFARMVRDMPFRTATPKGKPSDMTNLLLIATADDLDRAFRAAGWVRSTDLSFQTGFQTFRVMMTKNGYADAPMSALLLDGKPSIATWEKGLNTFDKRHHLRVFATTATWNGRAIWTASSTQDIGIGFSRRAKTLIHIIDEDIDDERDKVMNDLALTGCIAGLDLMARPWTPRDARNATGDLLKTDGAIGIIDVASCENPRPFVPAAASGTNGTNGTSSTNGGAHAKRARTPKARPNPVTRGFRQVVLTLHNDVVRNNPVYLGFNYTRMFIRWVKPGDDAKPPKRVIDIDGEPFEIRESGHASTADTEADAEKP